MMKALPDIKTLEKINRPREKLFRQGAQSLTDLELLAIMVGTGNKDRKLNEIVFDLLHLYESQGMNCNLRALTSIKGIGNSKAASILAAGEFFRRQIEPSHTRIQHPEDVLPFLQAYANKNQEHFIAITLNGAYEVIDTKVVTIGILNKAMVHPREVFADAIRDHAAAIIVAHNHPSGSLTPSREDFEITDRLQKAGDILGIPLLDHIIISKLGHYSFLNNHSS